MRVYEVEYVYDKYKALNVDRTGYSSENDYEAAFAQLEFLGQSKKPWSPPQMHFRNPAKPDPDFWQLLVGLSAFAAGPKALDSLYSFFEMAGEILPLPVKGKELAICNVLQVYDAIDQKKTDWSFPPSADGPGAFRKPVFVPDHMQISTLFKVPERLHTVYCWEEDGDPETEFKACVEQNKLKGLDFVLAWTDKT
jgi:hypothetical protein